jgi:hypothetical protein
MRKNLKRPKSTYSLLLLGLCFLVFNGCHAPAFQGGIRVQSFTALTIAGGTSKSPTSGVVDTGNLVQIVGPGNGSQTAFEGVTGLFGIDDHRNARDNADWTITASFTQVLPQCPPASTAAFVPPGGAQFAAVCFL